MSDVGYRIRRTEGGKQDGDVLVRTWSYDEAKSRMADMAVREKEIHEEKSGEGSAYVVDGTDTAEIRATYDGQLIAMFEVEEFEQA